ncbi:M16 family metallopeptidase [Calditerrivibrio sp.]|uniref:M16 family metallopeptidase n=1 Tax=Calditerrivibrio sp. TaxID=2792612 RepID=UPI003D0B4274
MKFFKILMLGFIINFLGVNLFASEEFKLSNDVKVVYNNIPNIKITSVQLWMNTGSRNETKDINGISHFLEHMVFKGTKSFKPDEIDSIVEANGGQMNAATSKDYTFYYITIPTENVEVAFKVISEMVFDALFLDDEIEKEKPVVIEEIKRRYDDPTYDMWTTLAEKMHQGTSYSMEIIGTEDNVRSFNHQKLMDYYKKYYHPHNMTLAIVGDIDKSKAFALAEKYFSKKRDVPYGEHIVFEQMTLPEPVEKFFKKDVNQVYGLIAYPAPKINEKDIYALDLLEEILSGGEMSILNKTLKNEKGLVNSVFGGYSGLKYGGTFLVFYTCEPGKDTKVDREIMSIFSNILNNGIPKTELESARNRLKSTIIFRREKASAEAEDIGYSYTLGMENYYKNFIENINKTTDEDILRVLKEILTNNSVVIKTIPKK